MDKHGGIFGGTMLVAGTSIGGGMLALPVLTSLTGFFPSLVIYLLCWLCMASTGLLLLEVCLWMDKDSNLVSMAERTLGLPGKAAAWFLYLFLFYCLTVAYIVGCGNLTQELFPALKAWQAPLLFVAVFAPLVFLGPRVAGKFNIWLMFGLGISYFTFLFLGFRYVQADLLMHVDWSKMFFALPIAFTAFAYQGIVPTLYAYTGHDAHKARWSIIIGSFLPLITYAVWQWLILGIVPLEGPGGLKETLAAGENAVHPLKNFLHAPWIYVIGQFFAFFALVTSFIGVTLGLLDFLADGLKIKKTPNGKLFLCSLIFILPTIIAVTHPHIFLIALEYAGGFGCALLLGFLPVLMVWSGRYKIGLKGEHLLPGGRPVLLVLILFVLFEVGCEIWNHF